MEENQFSQNQDPAPTPQVGFPVSQPTKPTGKMNKWIVIFLGLLILGAGGVFFFSRKSNNQPEATPTPESSELNVPSPLPSATPQPIDRSKVKIEVQNGTGIAGEGAYLQGVLASLGYKNIKTANATNQDNTATVVTFAKSLSTQIVDEVTSKLEEIYKSVDTKTSSTQTSDVVIVTGLRKGATPRPSASPSASPTPTSIPTPTPIPTTAP